MKTARRPAATAGLMSERGLLPIMNVSDGSSSSVAHEAPIRVDVFFARRLDAIEQRTESGARELLQLFVALTLGEHQQPMPLREFLQRRLDVGSRAHSRSSRCAPMRSISSRKPS